jgi:hypothetical protein
MRRSVSTCKPVGTLVLALGLLDIRRVERRSRR